MGRKTFMNTTTTLVRKGENEKKSSMLFSINELFLQKCHKFFDEGRAVEFSMVVEGENFEGNFARQLFLVTPRTS